MKPPALSGQSGGLCCRLGGYSPIRLFSYSLGREIKLKHVLKKNKKKTTTIRRKLQTQVASLGNSPMFKEDMTQILDKLFQKYEKEWILPLPLLEASITLILNSDTARETATMKTKNYRPICLMTNIPPNKVLATWPWMRWLSHSKMSVLSQINL